MDSMIKLIFAFLLLAIIFQIIDLIGAPLLVVVALAVGYFIGRYVK